MTLRNTAGRFRMEAKCTTGDDSPQCLGAWTIFCHAAGCREKMVGAVQDHIGSLNWGYRTRLRTDGVKYINEFGSFVVCFCLAP